MLDKLTRLDWRASGNLAGFPLEWDEAMKFVLEMNETGMPGHNDRLRRCVYPVLHARGRCMPAILQACLT